MEEILKIVGAVLNGKFECYVVGGYVRDRLLGIPSDDVDFVVIGSGPEAAKTLVNYLTEHGQSPEFRVFENYGTAQVKWSGVEVEFVGARREMYERGSRKPIVENGTLQDDLRRRDFTINAMAIQVSPLSKFGAEIDLFEGKKHLSQRVLDTPGDPNIAFSDDPLRILRGIRFSCRLRFDLSSRVLRAMKINEPRLDIVSIERVSCELTKIMMSQDPARGIELLRETGLLQRYLPELTALGSGTGERVDGHKDNLHHSIEVLRKVASRSDSVLLRWAALLHDIGKPATGKRDSSTGEWSFYGHEYVGSDMIPGIFNRLRLSGSKYVQKMVKLHMRPGFICTDIITDSAVRRLLCDAGPDIDDLMLLGESDISSGRLDRIERVKHHYEELRRILKDLKERDAIRLFQPVLSGSDIMKLFSLRPGPQVGKIKDSIKNAVLDGVASNTREDLINYIRKTWNLHEKD